MDMPEQRTRTSIPDLCARLGLGEQAATIAQVDQDGPAFVEALVHAEEYPAALSFLAYLLPKREAIWWAWTCARRGLPPEPAPEVQAALDATERWIVQPSDANRRAAFELAESADLGTPAGCTALAVFFTGGSIAPVGSPDVPAPEGAAARAIAGSITLAAVAPPPEQAPERFQQYIRQGLEVAGRINLWESV